MHLFRLFTLTFKILFNLFLSIILSMLYFKYSTLWSSISFAWLHTELCTVNTNQDSSVLVVKQVSVVNVVHQYIACCHTCDIWDWLVCLSLWVNQFTLNFSISTGSNGLGYSISLCFNVADDWLWNWSVDFNVFIHLLSLGIECSLLCKLLRNLHFD